MMSPAMSWAAPRTKLITHDRSERWPRMGKEEVATRLARKIAAELGGDDSGIKLAAE